MLQVGFVRVGLGIACESHLSSASYAVHDIGKDHVPQPHAKDLATLRLILKHAHPSALRFAYLHDASDTFVVFNAPIPPAEFCDAAVPPFVMWNGACNEYYSPLSGETEAAMGCIYPPRPWVKGDQGTGTGTWSDIVH
jgi:hypothetical protein